jgi:hypothetical protein
MGSAYSYQPHEFVGFERREDRVEVTIRVTARNSRMFTDHPSGQSEDRRLLPRLREVAAARHAGGRHLPLRRGAPGGPLARPGDSREHRGDPAKPAGFGVRFITSWWSRKSPLSCSSS